MGDLEGLESQREISSAPLEPETDIPEIITPQAQKLFEVERRSLSGVSPEIASALKKHSIQNITPDIYASLNVLRKYHFSPASQATLIRAVPIQYLPFIATSYSRIQDMFDDPIAQYDATTSMYNNFLTIKEIESKAIEALFGPQGMYAPTMRTEHAGITIYSNQFGHIVEGAQNEEEGRKAVVEARSKIAPQFQTEESVKVVTQNQAETSHAKGKKVAEGLIEALLDLVSSFAQTEKSQSPQEPTFVQKEMTAKTPEHAAPTSPRKEVKKAATETALAYTEATTKRHPGGEEKRIQKAHEQETLVETRIKKKKAKEGKIQEQGLHREEIAREEKAKEKSKGH